MWKNYAHVFVEYAYLHNYRLNKFSSPHIKISGKEILDQLIKSCLKLLIGFVLIIKNKNLDESIFLLFTVLTVLYLVELFSSRWNQLTDKEKNKLTTFLDFRINPIFKKIKLINFLPKFSPKILIIKNKK